jgi:hypothetical protein
MVVPLLEIEIGAAAYLAGSVRGGGLAERDGLFTGAFLLFLASYSTMQNRCRVFYRDRCRTGARFEAILLI